MTHGVKLHYNTHTILSIIESRRYEKYKNTGNTKN